MGVDPAATWLWIYQTLSHTNKDNDTELSKLYLVIVEHFKNNYFGLNVWLDKKKTKNAKKSARTDMEKIIFFQQANFQDWKIFAYSYISYSYKSYQAKSFPMNWLSLNKDRLIVDN